MLHTCTEVQKLNLSTEGNVSYRCMAGFGGKNHVGIFLSIESPFLIYPAS